MFPVFLGWDSVKGFVGAHKIRNTIKVGANWECPTAIVLAVPSSLGSSPVYKKWMVGGVTVGHIAVSLRMCPRT